MAHNVPAECPSCAAGGIRSLVKLYQINLDEAAVFCENAQCPFPLFSQNICQLIISRNLNATSHGKLESHSVCSNLDFQTRSGDTDSVASSYSVSSWASNASTVSSVTSSVVTPPPKISSKPPPWLATQGTPVYQPLAMTQKQKVMDWMTPVPSIQSSPASSILSANDREVDFLMNRTPSFPTGPEPTPSPSPLLSEFFETTSTQHTNTSDEKTFLDSLAFWGLTDPQYPESKCTADYPTQEEVTKHSFNCTVDNPHQEVIKHSFNCTADNPPQEVIKHSFNCTVDNPPQEEVIKHSYELYNPNIQEVAHMQHGIQLTSNSKVPSAFEFVSSTRQSTKRPFETVGLDDSPPQVSKALGPDSMPVWGDIELPEKRKRPRKVAVKKARVVKNTPAHMSTPPPTPSLDSAAVPSFTPTPTQSVSQPPLHLPQSQVAVDVNANGTPVFIINPAPISSPSLTAKSGVTPTGRQRGRPKKATSDSPGTSIKPKAPAAPRSKKKKVEDSDIEESPVLKLNTPEVKKNGKKDPFCIQSLVSRFIQAAKSKKLPESTAS